MSLSVSIARHQPLCVGAAANVAAAWKANDRGHGFFSSGGIPFRGDRGLEFSLNVRVRPHHQFAHFSSFPEGLHASGHLLWHKMPDFGVYLVKQGKAAVLVAVDALVHELERDPVYFDPLILVRDPSRVRIQMTVCVKLLPSPPRQIADTREWDTQFFQGGLPSLGRRRP